MDHEVNRPLQKRQIQLLGEEALTTNLRKWVILFDVAGRADDL
jgi:hypothetical protein